MSSSDVVSLRQFYHTPFGEAVAKRVAKSVQSLWPSGGDDCILAIGYAMPYIQTYEGHMPLMLCMPATQGASYWPPDKHNVVFLAHESELPLAENSVNRVLLVHSLEHSEQLSWMMREIWRVLTPGGRVLAVVPNRLSLWSRSSRSPFGHGRPFNMAQLRELMTANEFTLTRSDSALYTPPLYIRWCWRIAPCFELLGKMFFPLLGGVLLQEAEKQVYASIKQPVLARKPSAVPLPAVQPALGRS